MSEERTTTRREFLRSLGRGAALGALAVGGGWLLSRSDRCVNGYVCPGCPLWADCGLPEKARVGQASSLSSDPPTAEMTGWKPVLRGRDE